MEFKPSLIVYRTRIRKLFSTDLPQYLSHLLRLDADSRRKRFGSTVSDAFLAQYAQRCFGGAMIVYAYMEGGRVCGAAEFMPYDNGGNRHAEVAFSVESGWRRKGIGAALFERLIVTAGNRQIARFVMHCVPQNLPMQRLALRFNAQMTLDEEERAGVIVGLRPTLLGMAQEVSDDFRAFAAAVVSLQGRIWGLPLWVCRLAQDDAGVAYPSLRIRSFSVPLNQRPPRGQIISPRCCSADHCRCNRHRWRPAPWRMAQITRPPSARRLVRGPDPCFFLRERHWHSPGSRASIMPVRVLPAWTLPGWRCSLA